MAKRLIPERGTPEAEEIIALYPTASDELMVEWVKRYEYGSRHTFTDAVYRTYGIRRDRPLTTGEKIEYAKADAVSNLPLIIKTGGGFETMAVLNDPHNPYEDKKALSLVEGFLVELQPDYLVYNGDANDFYLISKFDKNPDRIPHMQGDINSTKAMFRRHRRALPNTRMIFEEGNHEDRLRRFLWSKVAVMASLDCLTIPELFDLKEYEIEYVPYECGVKVNDVFLVIHSNIASVHSSYTAKRLFEKHGGCGICGHTHRGGSFYKTDRFGIWGWWENFCLCDLHPDYMKHPNWQHGFSLVHFKGDRFWVEQIPIVNYKFIYGGKLYE